MLPILTAFAIERAPIKGGSTYPCLLSVVDENGAIKPPHVVKIFKPENRDATCREVFANILAQQFDLRVPEASLVKVEIGLLAELRKIPIYSSRKMEPGYYFGTEMIQNALDFSTTIRTNSIESWNQEMIFAFDVLIRNSDRRLGKPNLFLHKKEPFLIDHELSLNISKTFQLYKGANTWNFIRTSKTKKGEGHIFYKALQKKAKNNQLDFSPFLEYIRALDIDILSSYELQLAEFEYHFEHFTNIVNYLKEIKRNPDQFHELLKHLCYEPEAI